MQSAERCFQPYRLFAIKGILILIISFFVTGQTVDVHFSDTYFVLDTTYLLQFTSALLLALFAVGYFLKAFLVSYKLSWVHVFGTVALLLVLLFFVYSNTKAYHPGFHNWKFYYRNNQIIMVLFACIL